jgi:hypothetical protein
MDKRNRKSRRTVRPETRHPRRAAAEWLEPRQLLSISPSSLIGPYNVAGTTWAYTGTSAQGDTGSYTQTVIGPATFNGTAVNEIDTNYTATAYDQLYYGFDSAGDYVLYGSDDHTASDVTHIVYSPYETIFPATMDAGVAYTDNYTEYDTDASTGVVTTTPQSETSTLASETTTSVTVPADTYDAYTVTVVDAASHGTGSDGSTSDTDAYTSVFYAAPNVGFVKVTTDNGGTIVLTSFGTARDRLSVGATPAQVDVAKPISPALVVTDYTATGSVNTDDTDAITATLTPLGSATGTLGGTTTETPIGGVATFDNLVISKPGRYTLTFTDTADHTGSSGTIQVINGKLVVLSQPGNVATNAAAALTVELVDLSGNVQTSAAGTVVLSLNTVTGGTGAVLAGTTSAPLVNGVATFTSAAGPRVNVTGSYTLTATDEDASTGTLAPIDGTQTAKTNPFSVGAGVVVGTVLTNDSKSLSITYEVASNAADTAFPVTVYRSSNSTYTAGDTAAVPVATFSVAGADATEGTHSITVSPYGTAGALYAFNQAQALRPDPTHNYLVATADADGTIDPDDATTIPQGEFRFWLVGAVTHGYVGTIPAVLNSEVPTDFSGDTQTFVDEYADSLLHEGYNAVVPFHWEYYADRAIPNQPVQQGLLMEKQVVNAAFSLGAGTNDVIDVNLIGWSRGTIVVNSALTALNTDADAPAGVQRGFICETLVDPHPANNNISGYSIYTGNNPITAAARITAAHGYLAFQTAVHDLQGVGFVIPPNVDAVSDMYQWNPASVLSGSEALLNLWGLSPGQITPNGVTAIIDHQVTTPGIGHSEIMLDTERRIITSNQTLQMLNLYPFGSSAPAMAAAVSATLAAAPADATAAGDHLSVSTPAAGLQTDGAFGLAVSVNNAAGVVDTTYNGTVTLALDTLTGGTLGGTVTATAASGIATFAGLTISTAGTHRITASADGLASASSAWFAVATDRFVVTTSPTGATLGHPFGLIVSAERADGSIDTGFTGVVTLTAAAEPSDIPQALTGTFARQAVAGTATFFGLTIPTVGDYLVTATSPGVAAGSSDGFTVSGGAATQLAFVTSLSTPVTATAPFSLALAAEDAAGNLDASFNGTITLTGSGPGTLAGTTTVTASGGIATFGGLTLSTAGAGYTLTATGDGLTATLGATAAAAGAGTQLTVTAPTDVTAGTPFTVTVSATDGLGTVDPTFTGPVTLSATLLGNAASLGGTLTATAVAGVATFGDITVATAASGYTFSATTTGLAAVPSSPVSAAAGAASQLVVVPPGAPVFPGSPFTVTVQAEDANGNLATDFTGSVTVAATGQSLGGTLSVTATNGVAVFSDLTLPVGATVSITATSGSLSGTATLGAVTADELVVTAEPQDGLTVASPFGLTVSAVGADGSVDAAFVGSVTVSLMDVNGTGATLAGTLTVTASGGVATFTGLSVSAAGVYGLVVTADAGAAATATDTFAVTAASPAASTVVPTFGKVKLPASAIAGQKVTASLPLTLTAGSTAASGKFTVMLYADPSTTLAGGQVLLGTFPQSAVLKAGKGKGAKVTLKSLPAVMLAGTYHILAEVIDPTGGTALVATSQTIVVAAPEVTLTAAVTSVAPRTVKAGKTFTTAITITNTGNVPATGKLTVTVALSSDGTAAGVASTLPASTRTVKIAAGKPLRLSIKGKLPTGAASFDPFVTVTLGNITATAAGPLVTVG